MSTGRDPNYFQYSTQGLHSAAFGFLQFLRWFFVQYFRYIYVLIALIVLFVLYHIFLYKEQEKSYVSEIQLVQNFESANYLYQTINAIDSKIAVQDTVFLKQVFGPQYNHIESVKIESIPDLFDFSSKTKNTLEIFKLLNEGHDAVANLTTYTESPFFKQHLLTVTSRGFGNSSQLITNLINYINSNEHYKQYGQVIRENTRLEIEDAKKSIAQINNILDNQTQIQGSSGSVYNIQQDYSNLIREKRILINNLLVLEIRMRDAENIIKVTDYVYDKKLKDAFPRKILYLLLAHLLYFAFLATLFFWKSRRLNQ
ncbi:MAG: hypothetical protein Q4F57_00205 [Weeksellaceae bacterium]|nr:hypothetical protein [Weeksellaceae bacterium]